MTWKLGAVVTYLTFASVKFTELVAEPIVVEHPQNVTVFLGDPFSMSCVFSDTVNGTWNYKGGEGSGVGRLLQADGQITNPNTKFSFVINATSEDHNGTWSCSDSDRPEIKSSEAYVTVKSRKISGPPASVGFFEGQDVELDCRLTFPANCTWLKDDFAIGHRSRVKYLQNNGIDTYDCSIHISEAREMDEGNWTCVASYNNVGQLKSKPASVDLNSITGHPENATVVIGNNITLTCAYNFEGQCIWHHNGSRASHNVTIHHGSNGTICSVLIPEVRDRDKGTWTCLISSANHRLNSSEAWLNLESCNITQAPVAGHDLSCFYIILLTVLATADAGLAAYACYCYHELKRQRSLARNRQVKKHKLPKTAT